MSMRRGVVHRTRPGFLVDLISRARCCDVRQFVVGGGGGYTSLAIAIIVGALLFRGK